MAPFFLEILDFQFLHVFRRYFNNFAIGLFVCKCALVSFYTYFLRILTIRRRSRVCQNPHEGKVTYPLPLDTDSSNQQFC